MTVTDAIRLLAPTEAVYVDRGVFVGYSVRVRGTLDITALSDAFDALRRAHPVHGSRLAVDHQGTAIVGSSALPSALKVFDGNIETVFHDQDLDPARAICELHVVRDGDRANVTLVTQHSVADGHHALAVLADLWSLYTDFAEGVAAPAVAQHGYPMSMEALFAERGIGAVEVRAAPAAPGDASAETDTERRRWVQWCLRCQLDETQTRALVDLGHREGATINGLVSAAILLAVADVSNVPLTEIPYAFLVDLRSRISPPVALTAGTNVLGTARYITEDGVFELVDIARAIGGRLAADLADHTIHDEATQITATPPAVTYQLRQAPASAYATNWGKVPALRHPEALEFEDLWPLFQFDAHVAVAAPTTNPLFEFVILSFQGRLSVDLLVTDPDNTSEEIVAALRSRLLSVL
ncbi:phthiocerol/phthiodiolone dimycocerosyl transferase family protein [Nocardia sp. CA-128927]|uniref:phthiocerol/phthiodiolone dimycocerosyl transferase family protein n=1 Tax=Nocardia sp. CA-128927 TaxID=3239975 RepID=UPI003D976894